jgi:hypothetical protein
MTTKSASLRAFNTHFDEFIEDIINVFPDNNDIKSAKNMALMSRKANVTLIVKVWYSYIYGPYKDRIDSGDLDFFITKDYCEDFNGVSNASDIMKSIDSLRSPIKDMSLANKAHSLKYVQNLCKLSELYNSS